MKFLLTVKYRVQIIKRPQAGISMDWKVRESLLVNGKCIGGYVERY